MMMMMMDLQVTFPVNLSKLARTHNLNVWIKEKFWYTSTSSEKFYLLVYSKSLIKIQQY